ncbi:hypothetical protein TIFTF001_035844 [Ficus carica]|uniref:Uncharacterized protein n=1 Tax=Ficus carica TaxID=3494 RepID=A0AA88EBJ1_FICCA|nr:hypothetical protein TIFTF001_035844 [Ficus carica]
MQKKKVERNSVLIGFSSTSDTANANKVSNLLATADARWWSVAGQAVKCGNFAATRFAIISMSLQSWYQSGFLQSNFTVSSPSPPSLYDDMDPAHVDEDRDAVTSFYESHPLIFEGTRRTVSIAAWLYDMELIFRICHIEARLQISLASRCFAADARLWWMTLGEREMPSRTWAHFRMLVIARYGPVLDEGANEPYRDPEIYRDMYHERYYGFVTDWHAYPQESMGHYCRRFQEAMLPHIPQDIPSPGMQALVILRNGLHPQIRQHTPMPTPDMTVGHMTEYILDAEIIAHAMQADAYVVEPEVPEDDAGMPEPVSSSMNLLESMS